LIFCHERVVSLLKRPFFLRSREAITEKSMLSINNKSTILFSECSCDKSRFTIEIPDVTLATGVKEDWFRFGSFFTGSV